MGLQVAEVVVATGVHVEQKRPRLMRRREPQQVAVVGYH